MYCRRHNHTCCGNMPHYSLCNRNPYFWLLRNMIEAKFKIVSYKKKSGSSNKLCLRVFPGSSLTISHVCLSAIHDILHLLPIVYQTSTQNVLASIPIANNSEQNQTNAHLHCTIIDLQVSLLLPINTTGFAVEPV